MNNCANCQLGLDGKEQVFFRTRIVTRGAIVEQRGKKSIRNFAAFTQSLSHIITSSSSSFFFLLRFSLSSLSLHFLISGFEYRFEKFPPFLCSEKNNYSAGVRTVMSGVIP